MSEGFTVHTEAEKIELLGIYKEWLELANFFVGEVKQRWSSKSIAAHVNEDNSQVIIFFKSSRAILKRKGSNILFENCARAELKKIDPEIEQWTISREFTGWQIDQRVRDDIGYLFARMMDEFLKDSEVLWNSHWALQNALDNDNE